MKATVGIAAAAIALTACGSAPEPERIVALRVLDLVPTSAAASVVRAEDVTFARESRRAVSMPRHVSAMATLATTGPIRSYAVDLPPDVRTWGQVDIVRTATMVAGQPGIPMRPQRVVLDPATVPQLLVAPTEVAPEHQLVDVYGAARPEAHDVETRSFVVPDGAALEFGAAVLAPGPRPMLDIPMRLTAWDGSAEHELWQARLPAYHEDWRDVRVPLDRFAGRSVRLRFSSRPGSGADQGVLGVFGEPIVTASRHATAPAPHVILISIDTLRAASVGAYGSAAPTTPTLDALAADGVLFENAFSTAAFTLPGHMSMFTGLWFHTHRALNFFSMLALDHRTLPELLQGAGFALGASTSGAWIIPGLGFRRGFDLYHERGPTSRAQRVPIPYACFTRGLDWLRQNRDRPTFLFLHDYQAHAPYLAPPPYDQLFGESIPDAPDAERLRQRYERAIRYTDDQLRAFFEGLDALGLRDTTLVIVTADHGEAFGERGMFQHTHDVHDEIARVPLVMRLPGVAVPGRRVTEPVSIADIAPTVLDVLGLPAIPEADGESLFPLLTGAADRLPRDAVFTEAESQPYLGWTDLTAAHTRTTSCIDDARRGTQECWDRRVDPWQLGAPLRADAASPEIAATKAALVRFLAAQPPAGAPLPDADVAKPAAIDEERREQLRALGYAD